MYLPPRIEGSITPTERFILFEVLESEGPVPAYVMNEGLRIEFGFTAIQAGRAIKKAIDNKMVRALPFAELDIHENTLF